MQRKPLLIVAAIIVAAVSIYESRYSGDMQEHIDQVNSDLENVQLQSTLATGLMGSLQVMTDETRVAGEIFETHEHVHTLRDELLARKVKATVEDGETVGGAVRTAIQRWPDSI